MKRRPRQPRTLLRVSIGLQRLGEQLAGTALSAAFAAFLVWRTRAPLPTPVEIVAHGAYLLVLCHAAVRRFRPAPAAAPARLDFELGSLAAVGIVEGIWWAQSGPRGPYWGITHVAFAVLCAFARPAAAAATWIAFAALIAVLLDERFDLPAFVPLVGLVGLSGLGTGVCSRLLVKRAERRCRAVLTRELERLSDAARSYRLSTSAPSESSAGPARRSDEGGELHAVSPVCKHMGCIVGWNALDKTWDCPCHGGRYLADGTRFWGPPMANLERKKL